jgi:hypothetical protein
MSGASPAQAPITLKDDNRCQSMNCGSRLELTTGLPTGGVRVSRVVIHVSRSGSGNGIGWSSVASTTAKTVAVAPTPSARISTITAASAGVRFQLRIA